MARPLRIEFSGAVYHITSRGNARQDIFLSDEDRFNFLLILADVVKTHNWLCHAFCLMDNHYHLLIETPDGNLSAGMQSLNGMFTQRFNKKYRSVGHLLQGRFKAFLVEKEPYLLQVARYIVLNPVRARMVLHPKEWPWSSYRATSGMRKPPSFLTTEWLLGQFHKDFVEARKQYVRFVMQGKGAASPFESVEEQLILGTQQFIDSIREIFGSKETVKEIPHQQRIPGRPSLEVIFDKAEESKSERNQCIQFARFNCGYSLTDIANHLDMHISGVSRIARWDEEKTKKEKSKT